MLDISSQELLQKNLVVIFVREAVLVGMFDCAFMASQSKTVVLVHILHSPYKLTV